ELVVDCALFELHIAALYVVLVYLGTELDFSIAVGPLNGVIPATRGSPVPGQLLDLDRLCRTAPYPVPQHLQLLSLPLQLLVEKGQVAASHFLLEISARRAGYPPKRGLRHASSVLAAHRLPNALRAILMLQTPRQHLIATAVGHQGRA